METLSYVAADGTTLNLTDYTTYFLRSRRGFAVPPQQLFHERIPGAVGARNTGVAVRERLVSMAIVVRATGHDDALAQERIAVNALTQDGYLESVVNGVTRRLDVAYRGGLEGDTASRQGGANGWPVLIPEYVAGQPYWYDPAPQQSVIDLSLAPAGITWPVTFPIFFPEVGVADSRVLTAGDAGGPWTATVTGPFTRVELMRLNSSDTLDLTWPVLVGEVARFNTGLGQRRVTVETAAGAVNATSGLSTDSSFWQLDPGANTVAVRVTGGNGATQIVWEYSAYYLAPG
jgi:hypothetical protein